MAAEHETKLHIFRQWLQVNGVELRGCQIKYCNSTKGFGLFSANPSSDGVLLVVPLNLAITPMRVMEDPLLGPTCTAMVEEGEVDDRFLMILFLTVERLRKNSLWKPYLDIIPSSFSSPLWFTDDEFEELKETTIYQATKMQKKSLQSVFEDKVKSLVTRLLILSGDLESEVTFEDFLWANSVFWTRALNIPLPRDYVFPENQEDTSHEVVSCEEGVKKPDEQRPGVNGTASELDTDANKEDTLWVEGLVPGIDFCNHDIKAAATWEIDRSGLVSGLPLSMYLLSVDQGSAEVEKEIAISYGDKGNEELLYLYGFVIEENPDDYLMVHYPSEALQSIPFSDSKLQLLQAQKAELRCLLPRGLLDNGFFSKPTSQNDIGKEITSDNVCNYSWSGSRKTPSYINNLVFPEEFLTSLRTIAMQEDQLLKVQSLLEELVGTEGEREPSDAEVRAAVWEACGDSGALQLLLDLLNTKKMNLEEASGTEESDSKLLERALVTDGPACYRSSENGDLNGKTMSKNRWSSIVYRRGQKTLTRLFIREAEHALQLCLTEES